VDDHPRPCDELERLLRLNELFLTASTEQEKVARSPHLQAELDRLARMLGQPDFDAWAGAENFEMRVGADFVDAKVLDILRSRAEQG
jgi:uncharacterized Ntn-hydrolase superfamily protein